MKWRDDAMGHSVVLRSCMGVWARAGFPMCGYARIVAPAQEGIEISGMMRILR